MKISNSTAGNFSYVAIPSPSTDNSKAKNIVFVHGYPGRPQDFRWLTSHLTMHNLYFIALPGQGLTSSQKIKEHTIHSTSQFVKDCIEQLGIDSFYIVGHSMGGTVATDVALQCYKKQKNCMGLILLSAVGLRPHKGFRNSYPKIVYSLTKKPFDRIFYPFIKKAFVQMGFPKGIDQTTIKVVLEYASNFSFQKHSQNLISVANSNVPIMVIYTKNDPLIEVSIFEEICSVTSPTLICVYEDGGHNPQRKYNEDIGHKIIQFIDQTDL